MQGLFSDNQKFGGHNGWRGIWYFLACAQQAQGISRITNKMREELLEHLYDPIDYARAAAIEQEIRHDVMAHQRLYGEVCSEAAGIIALAATSCDTTDNVELLIMRKGLILISQGLARVIDRLSRQGERYKNLATLGSTHYQNAAITTVGKRICMWAQNFLMDLKDVENLINTMRLRGLKGATGTQASFLELFDGDEAKVLAMERCFVDALGFDKVFTITGQTYPRKVDSQIMAVLSRIAQSASKMGFDMRLLAHDKEMEEPFESTQVGSSAMSWKRNPMRDERACSLSRLSLAFSLVTEMTESVQFLERSLDDSAARRVAIPESFLSVDAILRIMQNVSEGLVVYPAVIRRRLDEELPFMIIEKIIVEMVKAGANRQECHEKTRVHSQAAATAFKLEGKPNDLLERILGDEYFAPIHDRLAAMCDPNLFVGRAPQQVDQFLQEEVGPALEPYRAILEGLAQLSV